MVILPLSSGYQRYRVRLLVLILAVLLIVTIFAPGFAAPSRAPFVNCNIVTSMELGDCQALVALYNSTNGATWTTSTDWLVTDLPCTWFGVICFGNRLGTLTLNNNNLVGTLPAEIGNFDLAIEIHLADNNLSGAIPATITGLDNILILNLSNNTLTGGIPVELGVLAGLNVLELGNNDLGGTIPLELGNLTGLINLGLYSNELTGTIPAELNTLIELEILDLSDNQLTGTIPAYLGTLPDLMFLELGSNSLSGGIPTELGTPLTLQYLGLSSNGLTGTMPVELGNLTSLTSLDLSQNQLTGAIPPEFGDLLNLLILKLDNNLLTGAIPPEIGNLISLEELYLQINNLSGTLPVELGNLGNLRVLSLYANSFSGVLPVQLGNLALLESLEIDRNQFQGDFPPELALPSINDLDVGYNMLTASDPAAITFLDSFDVLWRESQNVSPDDLSATFDPTTGIISLEWTPILYTRYDGDYTIGCDLSPGGSYSLFQTQTIDKTDSEISFSGLPTASYFCAINTFTPANVNNANDLTSPFSLAVPVTVTTQPAPTNDDVDNPLVIDNEPFQLFMGNFNAATSDGGNTPSVPGDCTNANLNNAPSLYFTMPANESARFASRLAPRGGPGYFTRGFAVVAVGGPGHFVRQPDPTDTVIAIYRKNADGSLTFITCNDDIAVGTPASSIGFQRYSEFTYQIAVWTKDASSTVVLQAKIVEEVFNGSFNQDLDGDKQPDGWKTGADAAIAVKCNKPEKANSAPCMLQIKGTGVKAKIKQSLDYPAGFEAGDLLTISAYLSRSKLVAGGKLQFKVNYTDPAAGGGTGKGKAVIDILPGDSSGYEQTLTPSLILETTISKATIQLSYNGITGRLRIDDITLITGELPGSLLPLPASSAAILPLPPAR